MMMRYASPIAVQRCLGRRPFLFLALAAGLGILMADFFPSSGWHTVLAVSAGLLWMRARGWVVWLLPTLLVFHAWHEHRLSLAQENPVRLRLLELPDRKVFGSVRGALLPLEEDLPSARQRVACELTEISWGGDGAYAPARGRLVVLLPRGVVLEQPGHYELTGLLFLPEPPRNPGEMDLPVYQMRHGFAAGLAVTRLQLLVAQRGSWRFALQDLSERSRAWMVRALSTGLEHAPEEKAVLLAMALGASDAAGEGAEAAFRQSGTLHIFAVSGLHVALLAGIFSLGLRLCGAGVGRANWLLIVAVFFYAFITGWRPSAVRAAIMIAVHLLAVVGNRKSDLQNSLGLAALLIWMMDSQQLFHPGFQLSFLVLAAIAWFAPPLLSLTERWTRPDPFLPPSLIPRMEKARLMGCRFVAGLFCTSAAAWVGSLPLTLGHFRTMTPVGLLANTVLVPASAVSMGASCLGLLSAGIGLERVQRAMNRLNGHLAGGLICGAEFFSNLPAANFTVDLRFRRHSPLHELQVLSLNDGGAATFLRTPSAQWLIDCGSRSEWRRVVEPFLRQEGVNRLAGLVLTHGDSQHVGAAMSALPMGKPRLHSSVLEPWPRDSNRVSLRQLAKQVPVDSERWHRHAAGHRFNLGGQAWAEVLHPTEFDHEARSDDRAMVLLLHLPPVRVLMLSDAGQSILQDLEQRYPDLRCEVIVRGQNLTDQEGIEVLIAKTGAQALISSHDERDVLERIPESLREYCQLKQVRLIDLRQEGRALLEVHVDRVLLSSYRDHKVMPIRLSTTSSPPMATLKP